LQPGEEVDVSLPQPAPAGPQAEAIPLDVLYEDDDLVVVNKPAGMVVHPAKGHWAGTLTGALAFHFQQLSSLGGPHRPGIVHRLDRDTSGVIVVAKTDQAHMELARQFEQRCIEKEYFAISRGAVDRDRDWIEQPVGVHPYHRERMAIRAKHGTSRAASTFYEVDERFDGFVTFRVWPKTGRTHQIRVHLDHIGCPVLCDPLYGGHKRITRGEIRRTPHDDSLVLDRLALHARRLHLRHPASGELVEFTAPLAPDLAAALEELRQFRRLP
jgi:23S rRNA pseudouridine1911/1915/1917 synthase